MLQNDESQTLEDEREETVEQDEQVSNNESSENAKRSRAATIRPKKSLPIQIHVRAAGDLTAGVNGVDGKLKAEIGGGVSWENVARALMFWDYWKRGRGDK